MLRSLVIVCIVCLFFCGQDAEGVPDMTTEVPKSTGLELRTKSIETAQMIALIKPTLKGDWKRISRLLDFEDVYDFGEFNQVIDESIWLELKTNRSMLQSKEVLKFLAHVKNNKYLSDELKSEIKFEVLNETKRLFTEYLFPNGALSPEIEHRVNNSLRQIDNGVLADIFQAAYDDLLLVHDPLEISDRLFGTKISSEHLTLAYMKLLQRDSVQSNGTVMSAIHKSLTGLYAGRQLSPLERKLRRASYVRFYTNLISFYPAAHYIGMCVGRSSVCLTRQESSDLIDITLEPELHSDDNIMYYLKFGDDEYIDDSASITSSYKRWYKIRDAENGVYIINDYNGYALCLASRGLEIDFRSNYRSLPECVWQIEYIN